MKTLFYDIEVFKYQSCVVFLSPDGEVVRIFTTSLNGLGNYIDKGIEITQGYSDLKEFIQGKTLIGYNNHYYDDYILYAMCEPKLNEFIKEWNDNIIEGKRENLKRVDNITLDVFQQIDVSKPSLKKVEGNLGKNIYESDVAFDLDRPLTPLENRQVIDYCINDVRETINVYNMRKDYFSSKQAVIDMLPEDKREMASRWNTTSIVGQLLRPSNWTIGKRLVSDDDLDRVPEEVKEMWLELDNTFDYKFEKKKVKVEEAGCLIEFGWGGLHGAPKGVFEARNVKLLDVGSMYPSILVNFNGLGDKTKDYKDIMDYRLELKHQGKKKEQAPYKLILNSTYGLLNNQYSALNKPSLAFSICIQGQIVLYELAKRLHHIGCKVFNINTDGVAFVPSGDYKKVWEEWEKEFNLSLELDEFDYWIQKDVNNYIAVDKKGNIKTKGGDVNNYTDYEDGGRNYYFNNSNIRIVQKALVDKIVYNIPIAETIYKNVDKPELYQYILQAGSTYEGTFDNYGNKLQKVNRVFAAKNSKWEVYKKKSDGSITNFPNVPNQVIIHNADIKDFKAFKNVVDLQWYNDLAEKVYERWKV